MIPGYVMYEGFGLNLALSHIIAAEDDNTEFTRHFSSFKLLY
jgi:enoyl-CoA hydratase/carnithine racemase